MRRSVTALMVFFHKLMGQDNGSVALQPPSGEITLAHGCMDWPSLPTMSGISRRPVLWSKASSGIQLFSDIRPRFSSSRS
jgi:hypothetical protein